MTWFTKMLGSISHSQQSYSRPRRSTRLGVEVLDERALPSGNPLMQFGDNNTDLVSTPTPVHAALVIPTEAPPVQEVRESVIAEPPIQKSREAVTSTAGTTHTPILVPAWTQKGTSNI
jgi:hypothetical protein